MRALAFALFLLACPALALAEGYTLAGDITSADVTVTTGTLTSIASVKYMTSESGGKARPVQKVTLDVTSTTGGDMTFTTERIQGRVMGLGTDPGNTPTDNWDLTIVDANGFDSLRGGGLNRDTSNTEYSNLESQGLFIVGAQTFTLAAMGSAKTAKICLWIEE